MRVFNKMRMKPCYYGVKSEFLTLFKAFEEQGDPFTVLNSINQTVKSAFDQHTLAMAEIEISKATH